MVGLNGDNRNIIVLLRKPTKYSGLSVVIILFETTVPLETAVIVEHSPTSLLLVSASVTPSWSY